MTRPCRAYSQIPCSFPQRPFSGATPSATYAGDRHSRLHWHLSLGSPNSLGHKRVVSDRRALLRKSSPTYARIMGVGTETDGLSRYVELCGFSALSLNADPGRLKTQPPATVLSAQEERAHRHSSSVRRLISPIGYRAMSRRMRDLHASLAGVLYLQSPSAARSSHHGCVSALDEG